MAQLQYPQLILSVQPRDAGYAAQGELGLWRLFEVCLLTVRLPWEQALTHLASSLLPMALGRSRSSRAAWMSGMRPGDRRHCALWATPKSQRACLARYPFNHNCPSSRIPRRIELSGALIGRTTQSGKSAPSCIGITTPRGKTPRPCFTTSISRLPTSRTATAQIARPELTSSMAGSRTGLRLGSVAPQLAASQSRCLWTQTTTSSA